MTPFGSDPSDHPSFYDPRECSRCDGTQRADCDLCEGTTLVNGQPCPDCDDGTVTCSRCEGTGDEPNDDDGDY